MGIEEQLASLEARIQACMISASGATEQAEAAAARAEAAAARAELASVEAGQAEIIADTAAAVAVGAAQEAAMDAQEAIEEAAAEEEEEEDREEEIATNGENESGTGPEVDIQEERSGESNQQSTEPGIQAEPIHIKLEPEPTTEPRHTKRTKYRFRRGGKIRRG